MLRPDRWASLALGLALVGGFSLAQQYPARGRLSATATSGGGVTSASAPLVVTGSDVALPTTADVTINSLNVAAGGITTDGGLVSVAASGSRAYSATITGSFTDFGGGAGDFCMSDGGVVGFNGNVSVGGILTPLGGVRLAAGQIVRFDTASGGADLIGGSGNGIITTSASITPNTDVAVNLGSTSVRFSNIYGFDFHSYETSGNNAFAVKTMGARMVFGPNANQYAASDGGVISFAAPIAVANIDAGLPLLVPTMHAMSDGGVNAPQAIETAVVTLSGGTATYTFQTAFAFAPVCVCSDTAGSALACSTNSATASQVVLFGTVSDVINLICIGAR